MDFGRIFAGMLAKIAKKKSSEPYGLAPDDVFVFKIALIYCPLIIKETIVFRNTYFYPNLFVIRQNN